MFQKIAKHRANDASHDVHRPPLPQTPQWSRQGQNWPKCTFLGGGSFDPFFQSECPTLDMSWGWFAHLRDRVWEQPSWLEGWRLQKKRCMGRWDILQVYRKVRGKGPKLPGETMSWNPVLSNSKSHFEKIFPSSLRFSLVRESAMLNGPVYGGTTKGECK